MAPKSVLVTGASTGIGRACALTMDRLGWDVFAGVRKQKDADSLAADASARLVPLILDVVDGDTIEESARRVQEATAGRGLNGLVNNAGITVQGPLEYVPLDDLRKQWEVNITGQIAVTQAFLPAIRKATGRIVFMSSISGRAEALPIIGPYAASKRALEALAESLRVELLPWDIRVALIEPGSIATPIWEKGDATFDDSVAALPEEGRRRYLRTLQKARELGKKTGERGIPPERVADRVVHALTSSRPRFRYLVGNDAKAQAYVGPLVPTFAKDRAFKRVLGLGDSNDEGV
ncbi:MAG: SDR family oxidoreductase [Actinomycetota bacterium]|nr:SDR family oxidoreductase [Actinomycetota bacterium]